MWIRGKTAVLFVFLAALGLFGPTTPASADLLGGLTDLIDETVDNASELIDSTVGSTGTVLDPVVDSLTDAVVDTTGALTATVDDLSTALTDPVEEGRDASTGDSADPADESGSTTTTAPRQQTTTTTTTTVPRRSDDEMVDGAKSETDDRGSRERSGAVPIRNLPPPPQSGTVAGERFGSLNVLAAAGGLPSVEPSVRPLLVSDDLALYDRLLDWLGRSGSGLLSILAWPLLVLEILLRALVSAGSGLVAPLSLLAALCVSVMLGRRERQTAGTIVNGF